MAEVNFDNLTDEEKRALAIQDANAERQFLMSQNALPAPQPNPQTQLNPMMQALVGTPLEQRAMPEFGGGKVLKQVFRNAVLTPMQQSLGLKDTPEMMVARSRWMANEFDLLEKQAEQQRRKNLVHAITLNSPEMSWLDYQTLLQMDYDDLSKIASEMKGDPTALTGYPGTLGQRSIFTGNQEVLIEPTTEEKNIKAAGGYDDYLKRVEKESVAQATGDTLKELNKRSFDDIYARRKEIQTGVKNYGQSMANLEAARDLFAAGDIESGAGQSVIDFFRSLGARVEGFNPNLAGNELLSAIGSAFVVPLVKQLGANPTDTDLAEIQKQAPDLAKTPEGNALLIEFQIIAQNRARMRMETLRAFEDANEDLLRENPQRYNRLLDQALFDLEVSSEFKGPNLLELKLKAASVLQTVADGKIVGDAL